jgi:hypothetical protein
MLRVISVDAGIYVTCDVSSFALHGGATILTTLLRVKSPNDAESTCCTGYNHDIVWTFYLATQYIVGST